MKIQHRMPASAFNSNMTGRIDEDYQIEVDRTTERLEREFNSERLRLESAERRHARIANSVKADKTRRAREHHDRDIRAAWALVEERRQELGRLAALMTSSPQSATHRGTKSHRKVPVTHGVNL